MIYCIKSFDGCINRSLAKRYLSRHNFHLTLNNAGIKLSDTESQIENRFFCFESKILLQLFQKQ